MEATKISDYEIEIAVPAEVKTETKRYSLDFLRQQEIDILKSKNDFCEARDKELFEVRGLMAECVKLGCKTKIEIELARESALGAVE
jgi:hypothetical protein